MFVAGDPVRFDILKDVEDVEDVEDIKDMEDIEDIYYISMFLLHKSEILHFIYQ